MPIEQITISATLITATGAGCVVNYLGCKSFPKPELAHQENLLEDAMRQLRDAPKEQRTEGIYEAPGLIATTLLINMVGTNGFVHVDPKVFISNKEDPTFGDALQRIALELGYRGG